MLFSIKDSYLAVTTLLLGRKGKNCEMQSLYAYSGPYGKREIEKSFKTSNKQTKLFYGPFCTCFWNGSRFK